MRRVGHLAVVLCVALVGCAGGTTDDLPRQAVSGTVTLDGQPLARGTILFMPTSAQEGVPTGGTITDGKFSIPRAQGPVPGSYSVSISSVDSSETPPGPPGPPVPGATGPSDSIPEKYNTKTTLTAKVEAGKSNVFGYPLETR